MGNIEPANYRLLVEAKERQPTKRAAMALLLACRGSWRQAFRPQPLSALGAGAESSTSHLQSLTHRASLLTSQSGETGKPDNSETWE